MFKKVLFAILWFPLTIIDAIASSVSMLTLMLGRFAIRLIGAENVYNDLLETKIDGWTELKDSLKFDD